MTAPGALSAFVGAPARGREQTVWTPEFLLDRVDCVFTDGWADVFPSAGSPASVRATYTADPWDAWTGDWWLRNYGNPPFQHPDMGRALTYARAWFEDAGRETLLLVPARTRREWWCASVAGYAVSYLKSFPFLDSKTGLPYRAGKAQAVCHFPENLAMVYFGRDRVADFRDAFADVSTHFQVSF
jgi:hypothetical protein